MRRGGAERHVSGAVRDADGVGLCKTSLFVLPVEGKELRGAGTVWGGGTCSRTDGDTGAPATSPALQPPHALQAFLTLLLALWRQVPASGSPARIRHQAAAWPSPARGFAHPGAVPNGWEYVCHLEQHLFSDGYLLVCDVHRFRCLHP